MTPDFRDMLFALSDEHVEFMVVGAYALAAHGHPRATGDLDLWIQASDENARRVWRALARYGVPLGDLTTDDLKTEGLVFQVGVAPSRIDILTSIDGVAFEEAVLHRQTLSIEGLIVPVIGRSDLIRNKKVVGRPQDLADVARLEALSND